MLNLFYVHNFVKLFVLTVCQWQPQMTGFYTNLSYLRQLFDDCLKWKRGRGENWRYSSPIRGYHRVGVPGWTTAGIYNFSGAGHGVGIMMKHRIWNWIRSEIFTIYRNRIQSHRREKDFVNSTISTPHAKF